MRKHTRRKVWGLINPIQHAIQGAAITPSKELDGLRLKELEAVHAFANGTATLQDWHDITAMLNLAETMAKDGIGPEVLPVCEAAQQHLVEAAKRFERIKKMGTTGPGIQSFRDLFAYHDLQRQSVSRAEYERAIARTLGRIRSKAPEVVEL